mgnify:CR=1 FL=1
MLYGSVSPNHFPNIGIINETKQKYMGSNNSPTPMAIHAQLYSVYYGHRFNSDIQETHFICIIMILINWTNSHLCKRLHIPNIEIQKNFFQNESVKLGKYMYCFSKYNIQITIQNLNIKFTKYFTN